MKSSKSYQLHKSSEASESVLHIRKTCKAKGLEIVQKKKKELKRNIQVVF